LILKEARPNFKLAGQSAAKWVRRYRPAVPVERPEFLASFAARHAQKDHGDRSAEAATLVRGGGSRTGWG